MMPMFSQPRQCYLTLIPPQPLMRALAKVRSLISCSWTLFSLTYHRRQLVAVNNPDKIIFVGEALVGNEAVDQLTKFDRALRDFSTASGGKGRGIDGMLVTKWDTVDDKVCHVIFLCFVG